MKRFLIIFLIGSTGAALAGADCTYFRTSAKLESCSAKDPKTMRDENPYISVTEIPELAEPESKVFVQIDCECNYSLKGSSQRCDMDQSAERTSLVGTDSAAAVCRRGNELCSTVCPKELP